MRPGMTARHDPSKLRRRQTVEAASFVARGIGLIATIAFLSGGGPLGPHQPQLLRNVCQLAVCWMAIGEVLSAIGFRRPGARRYELGSAVQVALDTSTILGVVVYAQGYHGQTAWPLLVIAVLVGALRHRLAGALVVWAVSSAGFAVAMGRAPDPAIRHGEVSTAVVLGLLVAILCGIQGEAFFRQVKELERARRALHHQAHHDPLTGLPNREQIAAYASAQRGRALAVLLLDLNGFKQVNDTLGHAAGDRLLQEVGRRLGAGLREGDLAGRIGGDEFIVLMPGAGARAAADLAARLRDEIRRPIDLDGRSATVGTSIGIACRAAGDQADLESLSREADAAMYRDKAASRSRT